MNYLDIFPKDLTNFVLVTLFSLLIGLSQRKRYMRREETPEFGSDRTFTLIGILGYILYILDPNNLSTFLCGGLAIVILLGINYVNKLIKQNSTGITAIMTSLITYCLGPLIYTQELWIPILIVVTILVLTEMKEKFINFT
ncbi:MAG TPA: MgtC/SapB family protein, partial [Paludibacteraceae bacterium]|nr:MgtC/SapB family protein [Paludibacteraceae bacterium]